MWHLGTCCGQKGITLGLKTVGLKFCVVPVSEWYLGMYFCWRQAEEWFFGKFCCFRDPQLGLIILDNFGC